MFIFLKRCLSFSLLRPRPGAPFHVWSNVIVRRRSQHKKLARPTVVEQQTRFSLDWIAGHCVVVFSKVDSPLAVYRGTRLITFVFILLTQARPSSHPVPNGRPRRRSFAFCSRRVCRKTTLSSVAPSERHRNNRDIV